MLSVSSFVASLDLTFPKVNCRLTNSMLLKKRSVEFEALNLGNVWSSYSFALLVSICRKYFKTKVGLFFALFVYYSFFFSSFCRSIIPWLSRTAAIPWYPGEAPQTRRTPGKTRRLRRQRQQWPRLRAWVEQSTTGSRQTTGKYRRAPIPRKKNKSCKNSSRVESESAGNRRNPFEEDDDDSPNRKDNIYINEPSTSGKPDDPDFNPQKEDETEEECIYQEIPEM